MGVLTRTNLKAKFNYTKLITNSSHYVFTIDHWDDAQNSDAWPSNIRPDDQKWPLNLPLFLFPHLVEICTTWAIASVTLPRLPTESHSTSDHSSLIWDDYNASLITHSLFLLSLVVASVIFYILFPDEWYIMQHWGRFHVVYF